MKEVFLAVVTLLIGHYSLVDIWAGFISASISSLLILRAYRGKDFWDKITLKDVFIWMFGIFVIMRSSNLLVDVLHLDFLKEGRKMDDAVILGFIAGIVNTILFVKNYTPIKKIIDKFVKNI